MNVLERNDRLLVLEIGLWGMRAAALGTRLGAHVQTFKLPEGEAVSPEQLREVLWDQLLTDRFRQ